MDSQSGKGLSGLDHLRQSVRDILTTRLGSRVMRRTYGSRLFQLVDAPLNKATLAELYAATAEALSIWEPRMKLLTIKATSSTAGAVEISITSNYLESGEVVTIDGIVIK